MWVAKALPFLSLDTKRTRRSVRSKELETGHRGSAYRTAFTPEEATGSIS